MRSDLFPLEKRNRIFLGRRLIVDASTVRLIEGANSGIALNGASLTASCTTARLQSLEEGGLGSTADDLLFGTSPIRPGMYLLTPLGQIYAQAACVGLVLRLVYTKDRAAASGSYSALDAGVSFPRAPTHAPALDLRASTPSMCMQTTFTAPLAKRDCARTHTAGDAAADVVRTSAAADNG